MDDCSNAAKYLAEQGKVDPKRLCITGGSAGGYTTLACLAFRWVFTADVTRCWIVAEVLLRSCQTVQHSDVCILTGSVLAPPT